MIKCYECLYNNDGICQNECSFDLEDDNCLEFESRDTYAKGYQQGRAKGAREFAEWLANGCAFMRRLGEDDMRTVDEFISEWQKVEEQ